jgi:hypothetical protein
VSACPSCDEPATVLLTLLHSTSLDAVQEACWPCALDVMEDWATGGEWADVDGWSVERLRRA